MKAQSFKINGSKNLLKAIEEELTSLGYKIDSNVTTSPLYIAHSCTIIDTKHNFKALFYGNIISWWDKTFELPQQYNKALAFAKEQLNDKYWGPQKWAIGTFVVFLQTFGTSKIGDIDVIKRNEYDNSIVCIKEGATTKKDAYVKWFATKEEAETFALTLKPVEVKLSFGNLEFTINKEKKFAKCDMGIVTLQEIKDMIHWYEHRPKLLGYTMGFKTNEFGFGCCMGNYGEAKTILKAFD